jgi:hypothetical protein
VPDVDGLSLLFGVKAYQDWHHVLAHNMLFAAAVVAVSAWWVGLRPFPLLLVFLSFVSHLVGDYFGSGPGWAIQPWLPFRDTVYLCEYAWELASWQNFVITLVVGAVALEVAFRLGRTPLEFVHAGLERAIVDTLKLRRWPARCKTCEAKAGAVCQTCDQPVCAAHVASYARMRPTCTACAGAPGPAP